MVMKNDSLHIYVLRLIYNIVSVCRSKFIWSCLSYIPGIGFSMVYGAMLTKTNRISRIFHSASQSARRPSYISPRSQLIITAVLVSVQFMATLVWIVASTPDAEKVYPQRSEVRHKPFSVTNNSVGSRLAVADYVRRH